MGKYSRSVTGRVVDVKRHGHTFYGNPIFSVALNTVPGEWLRISDNASIVYAINNPEYREHEHEFELTRAGRISGRVRRIEGKENE